MSGGRPTKYDPKMCERVLECGAEGMGVCEMADELGIHYETFMAYRAKHPQFSEAVKEALRKSQAWWERKGRQATFGGTEGFNATSYIFNMKNRFSEDWKDKRETEHSGNVGITKAADLTDDELAKMASGK